MLNKLDKALLKKVVKAQHYPRDATWKLWAAVTKHHLKDFPNNTILAQLTITHAVNTVLSSEPHPQPSR